MRTGEEPELEEGGGELGKEKDEKLRYPGSRQRNTETQYFIGNDYRKSGKGVDRRGKRQYCYLEGVYLSVNRRE